MIGKIPNYADVPNGDQVAGAATYKCTGKCQGCLCDKYHLQFHFSDDDEAPFANVDYVAYFSSGESKKGKTDSKGYTEIFRRYKKEEISVHLQINDQ